MATIQLGIFAKTFVRPTLGQVLDAVLKHGLRCVQFNFACVGLPSMPDEIQPALADRIRGQMEVRQIKMAAISGTFNMIHPNAAQRNEGLRRLSVLARASRLLGTSVITLCTGTRDPDDMWRRHPENDSPQAWDDLIVSMEEALKMADEGNVTLGIEPEVGNVIDSAKKARRLLDEMRSSRLRIIMDAANLFHPGDLSRMRDVLDEAFDLLGHDIVLAHAKDLNEKGNVAAGKGMLDYDHYIRLLRVADFEGLLILHGLTEEQVAASVGFLEASLQKN